FLPEDLSALEFLAHPLGPLVTRSTVDAVADRHHTAVRIGNVPVGVDPLGLELLARARHTNEVAALVACGVNLIIVEAGRRDQDAVAGGGLPRAHATACHIHVAVHALAQALAPLVLPQDGPSTYQLPVPPQPVHEAALHRARGTGTFIPIIPFRPPQDWPDLRHPKFLDVLPL